MTKKQSSHQAQIMPEISAELQKELETLRAGEGRYRLLFETSPNALFLIGKDGHFLDANQAALNWYGYSLQEFRNMTVADLAASRELSRKAVGRVQHAVQGPTRFEWRHRRKDGRELPVEINTTPVKVGGEACTFAIVSDITERKLAEESIHNSEQKYRMLFDSMRQGVFYQQADGSSSDVNPAALEMLGLSREQFLGRDSYDPAWRIVREDGSPLPGAEHPSMLALQTGKSVTNFIIGVFNPQKQSMVWMTINAVPEFLEGESAAHRVAVTLHDITGRKQTEEALRESEQRTWAVIDHAPYGAHLYELMPDQQLVFTGANRAADTILGVDHQQFIGKTIEEAFPSLVQSEIPGAYRVVAASGEPYETDQVDYDDGNIRGAFEVRAFQTGPNRMAAFFRDITERKQAEEALRASEERFSTIFRVNPAASALTRMRDNQLIDVSQAWQDLTGYTHAEAVGHTANELNLWVESKSREQLIETLRQQGRTRGEVKIRQKSGGLCDVLMSAELIELAGEKYLLTMAQDITERKQIEEQIQQLNTELEQRVEERTRDLREAQEKLVRQEKLAVMGQLAGGVGHELRNPLSVINNAVYLLKLVQADASPQVKEYLGIIDHETHTAEKIISDLLEFSRTKSVEREPVVVKDMFRQVLERFPASDNVTVKFKLPADLPPVFADQRHMAQVFGNLTVNACQAMPEGGTLSLSAKKKGREIAISVTDTGTGITPENMKKLFEPLFTTKAKGIGLGLAVSRKLVEANDGRLEIQSEVGKGSTFTIILPASETAR